MKVKLNWLKKYYQYWLQRLEQKSLAKYYLSIEDLPVWNWWHLHEEKDYTALLKHGKLDKHAGKVLRGLEVDFHKTFGLHPQYEIYLMKLIDLEIAKNKVALGDKTEQLFVDIIEQEISQMKVQNEDADNSHFVAPMEKHYGFPIDPKTTSTFKFYDRVKAIEKEVEQMKKHAS